MAVATTPGVAWAAPANGNDGIAHREHRTGDGNRLGFNGVHRSEVSRHRKTALSEVANKPTPSGRPSPEPIRDDAVATRLPVHGLDGARGTGQRPSPVARLLTPRVLAGADIADTALSDAKGAQRFSLPRPRAIAPRAIERDAAPFARKADLPTADVAGLRQVDVSSDQLAPKLPQRRISTFVTPESMPIPAVQRIDMHLAAPRTVVSTATNLVTAVFTLLQNSTPGRPAESPLAWAVLALVRRQFANETPTVSPTVSAPDSLGDITISLPQADADGDQLVYTATDGAKGTVSLNPDGHSFTYTPNVGATGVDTLTITANDDTNPHLHGLPGLINALSFGRLGDAGHTSAPTAVTVKLNTPPTLTASPGTPDQSTGEVTVTVVATDPDGNSLTLSVNPPAGATGTIGTLTLVDAATGTYTVVYTPSDAARHTAAADTATDAQKADTVTFTVDDGHGAKLTSSVEVTIASNNDAPQFSTITSSTDSDGKITGTIVFTDSNTDSLSYSGSAATAKGAVDVQADGAFTYTPASDARFVAAATAGEDTDTFTVTAMDGHGGTVEKVVTVTITPAAVTSDGRAALKAAESVITSSVGAIGTTTATLKDYLSSRALGASDAELDQLQAQLAVYMAALSQAEAAGDVTGTADAKAAIQSKLGDSSAETLESLKAKLAAVEAAENALPQALKYAADARAVIAAQAAGDGKPVFSRVDYTVDPDGTVTGALTFIDPENQALLISGGVIDSPVPSPGNVAIGAFAALPSNYFRYTPTAILGATAQEVSFSVSVIDSDYNLIGVNVTIDVTTSSPPATLTDVAADLARERAALQAAITMRETAVEAHLDTAELETTIKEILVQIEDTRAAIAHLDIHV